MIMGGRYQKSVTTGTMMGMPFEGQGVIGYDNALKKFQSTWIDNFGTGTMIMEGIFFDKVKIIEFKGKVVDPVSGKELDARETMRLISKDEMQMEMFVMQDGKESKTMEIVFTREVKKK